MKGDGKHISCLSFFRINYEVEARKIALFISAQIAAAVKRCFFTTKYGQRFGIVVMAGWGNAVRVRCYFAGNIIFGGTDAFALIFAQVTGSGNRFVPVFRWYANAAKVKFPVFA